MTFRRRPPKYNVRRVTPHGTSSRGVTTNKRGLTVQYESFVQRRLILMFERDHSVFDYSSQPERIEYKDRNGVLQTYVPPFIVWRRDGSIEWHHIVYASTQEYGQRQEPGTGPGHKPPELRLDDQIAAAKEICAERRWRFVTHSDSDLPQKTLLANLQALDCFEPTCYRDDDVAIQVVMQLSDGEQARFQALTQEISDRTGQSESTVAETLYHLLWHGEIETDLEKLLFRDGNITPKTPIWLPVKTKERVA